MHRLLLQDKTFRELDIPIQPAKYRELEKRIQKSTSTGLFPVWHGYLLIGYDRYNLMQKYHRQHACTEKYFPRKTDAIAWICREQLKRTDLTKPATYWLLYRLYESLLDFEKRAEAKTQFQYKQLSPSSHSIKPIERPKENTAILKMIGSEFHYSWITLWNYVRFGKQLDQLEDMFPGVRRRILIGELDVARIYMDALMQMPPEELKKMICDPNCKKLRPPEKTAHEILQHREAKRKRKAHVETAIKQTPEYDPDAELNGLTFTVGAWTKAIKRTRESTDFHNATKQGRENLAHALHALMMDIGGLNKKLEEAEHE